MSEWVYKASETKVDYHTTRHLAVTRHFLCRTAFDRDGVPVDRVSEVAIGDVIHFFYRRKGSTPAYGSFVVVEGSAYPDQFGERVEGTALYKVREDPENADMIALLSAEHDREVARGYVRDSVQNCYTGWVLRRLEGAAMRPPAFDQTKLFPGPMTTLWHYPDPELPRKRGKTTAASKSAP